MLTVKHINANMQTLHEAPYGVTFVDGTPNIPGEEGAHLDIPNAEPDTRFPVQCTSLFHGMAYVMNEAGSTIGIYQLGEPQRCVGSSD